MRRDAPAGQSVPRASSRYPGAILAGVVAALAGSAVLVITLWPGDSQGSAGSARVQTPVPVTAVDLRSPAANNSPELAVDPTDSRFVVLASRQDSPYYCSLSVSGDGGRSWLPTKPFTHLPAGADTCYAPEVDFDASGRLHCLFVGLHGRGNSPMGVFLTTSTDRARTFTPPRRVLGEEHYMVRMAIDHDGGRLHLVWLQASSTPPLGGMSAPPNPIMTAHSDDGGNTFSQPLQVSDPNRRLVVSPALAIGPDHSVNVVYYDLGTDTRDYEGLDGPTWDGKWALVEAGSADGGVHFRAGTVVDDQIVPPERVILIYTMPSASLAVDGGGQLLAAWTDARNGDWDVLLRRSRDDGASWSPPQRLNDDPISNGRNQYRARLSVAPGGRIDAAFYDRRNDPGNHRNDVYITSSNDGGRSFSPNVRLTQHASDSRLGPTYPIIASARGLKELGSRIGLVSESDRALVAWADTHHSSGGAEEDVVATEVSRQASTEGLPWVRPTGAALLVAGLMVILLTAWHWRRVGAPSDRRGG